MLGFMGVNLMFDKDAIDPIPTVVNNINGVSVSSGEINHLVITKDISSTSIDSPDYTTWGLDTIMNAQFLGTLAAGSVDFLGQTISKILIKRRVSTDVTAKWTVVGQIDINGDVSALQFDYKDVTNKAQTYYRYGLVPVFSQMQPNGVTIEVEGTPIESDEVFSEFNGVFICDKDSFYRLYAGVEYGDTIVNQVVGVHETLGSEYPIIVANSKTKYKSGSLSAKVVNEDLLEESGFSEPLDNDTTFSRLQMSEMANDLSKFLTDKKPKILKDWNGNVWLVVFTDKPSVSYSNNWGMGLPTISGSWTEIGDANDSQDLANAGMTTHGGV